MSKELIPTQLSNLYASIIDQRKFSKLDSIMWPEFSMSGQFEINGLDNFILAMQQLENYKSTMHQIMNIQGTWVGDIYTGETYCIASHIFDADEELYKLDMGVIYNDIIELRAKEPKFLKRKFILQWQKTYQLDS